MKRNTLAHDAGVLRDVVNRFDGKLALNCEVVRGGQIRLNQEVQVDRHETAYAAGA